MAAKYIKMHMGVLIAFTLLSMLPNFAQAGVCRPCASTTEVALMVQSEDIQHHLAQKIAFYQTQFRDYSRGMQTLKTVLPHERVTAKNGSDLRKLIIDRANRCQRIRYLSLLGHGDVGAFAFDLINEN